MLSDFQKMLDQITYELLNSVFEQILTGQTNGSSAGGIVGMITNKILGIGNGKKGDAEVTNTAAVDVNTTATDENTLAIEQLTLALEASSAGSNAAAGASGPGSFWSAILGGVINGLVGGLAGSIGGGGSNAGGGGGGGYGDVVDYDVNGGGGGNFGGIPFLGPFGGARAGGGPVSAGMLYRVNENGEEYFQPNMDGNILNEGQANGRQDSSGGGNQRPMAVNIHFNLPQGPVTRQMEHQIASAALNGLERAMRKR